MIHSLITPNFKSSSGENSFSTNCRSFSSPSTNSTTSRLPILSPRNGRWRPQVPPSKPLLLTQTSPPPQPRHLSHKSRKHHHHLAQSQRGPTASRETDNAGQEKHKCKQAASGTDIIRTSTQYPSFRTIHSLTGLLGTFHR